MTPRSPWKLPYAIAYGSADASSYHAKDLHHQTYPVQWPTARIFIVALRTTNGLRIIRTTLFIAMAGSLVNAHFTTKVSVSFWLVLPLMAVKLSVWLPAGVPGSLDLPAPQPLSKIASSMVLAKAVFAQVGQGPEPQREIPERLVCDAVDLKRCRPARPRERFVYAVSRSPI